VKLDTVTGQAGACGSEGEPVLMAIENAISLFDDQKDSMLDLVMLGVESSLD